MLAFVLPVMYHLFEHAENVIAGVPTLDMVGDKWRQDIYPAIAASRYRDLLPSSGRASRGGTPSAITFGNGAVLKFLTGGGGDKSRAGYTSRVLVVTETDGFDDVSDKSREADKLSQLEARTRAFGDRRQIYLECTVSIEEGRTWQELKQGTDTRIAIPCPHCKAYVTPERSSLVGWLDAKTVIDAADKGHFSCPSCGAAWSEDDRRAANAGGMLVHRGQEIDGSGVVGNVPRTNTLGIRWSAVNNMFVPASMLAADEWKAARAVDEDTADREMRQFVWAMPARPPEEDLSALEVHAVADRTVNTARGVCPPGTRWLTVGIDLGAHRCHWQATAWRDAATPHVVDYGQIAVSSRELGVEVALLAALREFRDTMAQPGWIIEGGDPKPVDLVLIDAGWQGTGTDQFPVYQFCKESGVLKYMPAKGFGSGQYAGGSYHQPKAPLKVGEHYHLATVTYGPGHKTALLESDVDYWKTWAHHRLSVPAGQPGGLTLFSGGQNEHVTWAKHVCAERKIEEFKPGKGPVIRWDRPYNVPNHYLDAYVLCCVAGHWCGARATGPESKPAPKPQAHKPPESSRRIRRVYA